MLRRNYLLLAIATLVCAGCDSGEGEPQDPVLGNWESFQGPIYYLTVAAEEILLRVYFEDFPDVGPCYTTITYRVLSRDGGRWEVLQKSTDNEATFVFEVDAGELDVKLITPQSGETERRFSPSDQTVFTPDCLEV